MKITKIPLSLLKAPEKNVRIHSAKQIEEFKRSIEMFGQIRPIVCDEAYTIIAGNGLYAALTALGWTEADCYVVDGLSEVEKKKLMLADNRIFSLGVDDLQAFDEILLELDNDFDIPGYDESLLQTLTVSLDEADDYLSGYGLISDDSKAQMSRASEKYEAEEEQFAEKYQQYVPSIPQEAPGNTQEAVSHETLPTGHIETSAPPKPQEVLLQRQYLVCPKCGEKIWL